MARKNRKKSTTLHNPIKKSTKNPLLTSYKAKIRKGVKEQSSMKTFAEGGQALSDSVPGTLGFEVEQLFYHGNDIGAYIAIRVKGKHDQIRETAYSPDTYFEIKEHEQTSMDDDNGAYDEMVAESKSMQIALDVTTVSHESGVTRFYVPEFITRPYTMGPGVYSQIRIFADTVVDFYAFFKKCGDVMSIPDWVQQYNSGAGQHIPMSTSDSEGPFLSPDSMDEEAEYIMTMKNKAELDPLFAIHVNTSIYLEQMYSMEMRKHFPIFETYPQIAPNAKDLKLKDWPSCRRNEGFERWELALTEKINVKVKKFVSDAFANDKQLNDHLKLRLEGLFRTLIYSFSIQAYCESDLKDQQFSNELYETSYKKDFYLHGLPKVSFDDLVLNGLIEAEKRALLDFIKDESRFQSLIKIYQEIATAANINPDTKAIFGTGEDSIESKLSFEQFIRGAISNPLDRKIQNRITVIPKVIETGLPTIELDGQRVVLPVLEFRAPKGNGCTTAALQAVLAEQTKNAKTFAEIGFKHYEKPAQHRQLPSPKY